MNEYISQYLLFAAEGFTLAVLAVLGIILIIGIARAPRGEPGEGRLDIRHVNERLKRIRENLNELLTIEPPSRRERRRMKKAQREKERAAQKTSRVFVLDFDGDISASQVEHLREEVSAICQVAKEGDEVLLRLESSGGTVHGYGLAASQLRRLRDRGLRLTIAVDKVAASGGYMMACVAHRIIAAPFAIIGSIGVVGQLPNFSRLLKRHEIDFELHTAGRYKRTLTMLGENSDEAREKFRQDLEETHVLFRNFIAENRPSLDVERVSTGEHWYGHTALELGLVDELRTSDDALLGFADQHEVFELRYRPHQSFSDRLAGGLAQLSLRVGGNGLARLLGTSTDVSTAAQATSSVGTPINLL